MSKKAKSVEIPAAYQMLSLPLKKDGADRKVAIDIDGKIHVFKDKSSQIPADIQVDTGWENFDKFVALPKQTVLAYHEQYFKCEPPKGQSLTTTATYVWAYFIKEGTPRLEHTKSDGTPERKSSLGSRKYFLGKRAAEFDKHSAQYPPQMKTCFAFLLGNIKQDRDHITEEDFKRVVMERQAELKTRQDPWRIFQYYRPRLIQEGMVRYE